MSKQLGVGVMLRMLEGNETTVNTVKGSLGKRIESIALRDDALFVGFDDKTMIRIWDGGQSCCEHRYMVSDDKMDEFIGAVLVDMELAEAPDVADEYGTHEVEFLRLKTDRGIIVFSNHNEHNGWYGGFSIEAETVAPDKRPQ